MHVDTAVRELLDELLEAMRAYARDHVTGPYRCKVNPLDYRTLRDFVGDRDVSARIIDGPLMTIYGMRIDGVLHCRGYTAEGENDLDHRWFRVEPLGEEDEPHYGPLDGRDHSRDGLGHVSLGLRVHR